MKLSQQMLVLRLLCKTPMQPMTLAPVQRQVVTWEEHFNWGKVVLLSPSAQPAKGASAPGVNAPL